MKEIECHGLDTPERVCFYEQDFYVLSNFSAFTLLNRVGIRFDTSEAAYHWEKFAGVAPHIADYISAAPSAHDAFKHAENFKHLRRPDWDDVKVDIMRDILRAKVRQHDYVCRKLLATGDRELVENSWRDDFWGWGPNGDGQNMLGKLWMEIRDELRGKQVKP
ncbi:NADAR family protein [Mesorhizobium sp. GbtcB19]|uniref:NADAR family protein n=1 Tax=Mesorhizobium sp. GbtcB19 TaxID=2824764 RepID=UPI001C30C1FE|nr:NADAR family protein [Mesorhizobium sp. GbtcB19]